MKYLLIAIMPFLLETNKALSQSWVNITSHQDMVKKGISNITGPRLIHERLWQVHHFKNRKIGSCLFVGNSGDKDFPDKVLFMPNDFLFFIFKKNDNINWVLVKAVSPKWQALINSIIKKNADIPFFSIPNRALNKEEQAAISMLIERVKHIYCPVDEDTKNKLREKMEEYFGENKLAALQNEVVNRYLKAKDEYIKAIEKYNKDKDAYEKEMREYKERYDKYKIEYEKWVEEDKRYRMLKNKYDEYEKELRDFHRGIETSAMTFSNLIIIYDWIDSKKVYWVDQENGIVAYEEKIYNPEIERIYKEKIFEDRGLKIGSNFEVGTVTGSAFGINLGTGNLGPAPRNIILPKTIREHYNLREAIYVDKPQKPGSPDDIKEPEIKKPLKPTQEDPTLDKSEVLLSTPEISDDDYVEGLASCPGNLKMGLFDFGNNNEDVNTYIIDAPNAKGLQDWMLLTGGKCYKCAGWNDSWITEIFSPGYKLGIRILRVTDKVGILTSPNSSPERDLVLTNLSRAFRLAVEGRVKKNELKYLGMEGFTYSKPDGVWVLDLKGQEVNYRPGSLPADAIFKFDEWQNLFCRYPLQTKEISMDDAIVAEFFEDVAEGKDHWFKYYRQTPLAYLAKYCIIKTGK